MGKMIKKIKGLFKGKYRAAAWITVGVLGVVLLFAAAFTVGWIMGNVRGGPRPTVFEFSTVFTGQEDFRMVSVQVHLNSKETANILREKYRIATTRAFRSGMDEFFRNASKDTLQVTGEGLAPSSWLLEKIQERLEQEILAIDGSIRKGSEKLILGVTIYFEPSEI